MDSNPTICEEKLTTSNPTFPNFYIFLHYLYIHLHSTSLIKPSQS